MALQWTRLITRHCHNLSVVLQGGGDPVTVWTSWSYCHDQALRPFNAFISIIPKSSPWLFSDEVIQWVEHQQTLCNPIMELPCRYSGKTKRYVSNSEWPTIVCQILHKTRAWQISGRKHSCITQVLLWVSSEKHHDTSGSFVYFLFYKIIGRRKPYNVWKDAEHYKSAHWCFLGLWGSSWYVFQW